MEGHLIMSAKERKRMLVLDRVQQRQLNLKEAASLLGLSYRQTRRSYKRFGEQGAEGLIHKSRRRSSNRARPPEFREKVVLCYQDRYMGFGPTLAAEKLVEDGCVLDHETLRRWLLAQGLWHKSRKRRKHRSRRERRAHFGELVQMDGSHHRWFGAEKPSACLINMVDDATGASLCIMAQEETTAACMQALKLWIKRYGIPKELYTDRKNVFVTDRKPTVEEQLAGQEPLTAFGRAISKLGIEIIKAYSPQAKGRVERSHGVYQDRFVKELKLKGITTIEGANELLKNGFYRRLNKKFARKPQNNENYHRPVAKSINLDQILCFEHTRTVTNDWTVSFEGRIFQILKTNRPLPRPKDKVIVRIHLDGRTQLIHSGRRLTYKILKQPPHHRSLSSIAWRLHFGDAAGAG
jgi:transposase